MINNKQIKRLTKLTSAVKFPTAEERSFLEYTKQLRCLIEQNFGYDIAKTFQYDNEEMCYTIELKQTRVITSLDRNHCEDVYMEYRTRFFFDQQVGIHKEMYRLREVIEAFENVAAEAVNVTIKP